MVDLEWINPVNIQQKWAIIKEDVKKVKRVGGHWEPEDVYAKIKSGIANLHIGYLEGVYKGFLVTQQNMADDGPELHIWLCYSNGRKEDDLLSLAFPEVESWAKNINARRITFFSPRKGWEKNEQGFKPTMTIYEKELCDTTI